MNAMKAFLFFMFQISFYPHIVCEQITLKIDIRLKAACTSHFYGVFDSNSFICECHIDALCWMLLPYCILFASIEDVHFCMRRGEEQER